MYYIEKGNFIQSLVCRPAPSDPENVVLIHVPNKPKAHPQPLPPKKAKSHCSCSSSLYFEFRGAVVTNCSHKTDQDDQQYLQ